MEVGSMSTTPLSERRTKARPRVSVSFIAAVAAIWFAVRIRHGGYQWSVGIPEKTVCVWLYMAEIFPTNLRGRAMSVASSVLWASCLAVTLTFVYAAGVSGAFSLYAILSLIAFLFIWKWLPETRGRSLEEIQRNWIGS
jgi:Sugar (and other) transporter